MKRLIGGSGGGGGGGGTPGGSTTQVQYNNAGAFGGISTFTYDGSTLTTAGRFINSYNAVASSPAKAFTGTWFTGGTSTTTKPHLLIEPTGTTSTGWSTNGTGLGVNAASTFGGNLLDLRVNGTSRVVTTAAGRVGIGTTAPGAQLDVVGGNAADLNNPAVFIENNKFLTFRDTTGFWGLSAYVSSSNDATILAAGNLIFTTGGATERFRFTSTGIFQVADAGNIQVGTTTGTKIGTATTQKLGFYNKTPVVQPAAVANATTSVDVITQFNALLARMRNLGLIAP